MNETTLDAADLRRALANAGDGAFVTGGDGRLTLWNRAAERILGYTARETVGKRCCDILAGFDERGNRLCYGGCHVVKLLALGESLQHFDMKTRRKNGEPVWINVSVLSLASDGGAPGATVHLFRDVTGAHELSAVIHERLRASTPTAAEPGLDETLTRREAAVLRLMVAGRNTRAAADELHVSPATVRNHVQNILSKLGVHSRLEAVALATRRHWV